MSGQWTGKGHHPGCSYILLHNAPCDCRVNEFQKENRAPVATLGPPQEMVSLTQIKAALARIERIAQQTQDEQVGFAGRLSSIEQRLLRIESQQNQDREAISSWISGVEQSQGKLLTALNETSGRVMAIGNALGDAHKDLTLQLAAARAAGQAASDFIHGKPRKAKPKRRKRP